MRPAGTRLQAIKPGADVVAGQVQHLAPKLPVLLDLRFGFRGLAGKFAVCVAGLRDPAHGCLERRVLKLADRRRSRLSWRGIRTSTADPTWDGGSAQRPKGPKSLSGQRGAHE